MASRFVPKHLASMSVDVVYAQASRAIIKTYPVATPATVGDVLQLAASDPVFAGVEIERSVVGIFGRITESHEFVDANDRVEIYRALAADPKSARRTRVQQARRKAPSRPQGQ